MCLSTYCPFAWLFHFVPSLCLFMAVLCGYLLSYPSFSIPITLEYSFLFRLAMQSYSIIKFISCICLIALWHLISDVVFYWYWLAFMCLFAIITMCLVLVTLVPSSIVVFCFFAVVVCNTKLVLAFNCKYVSSYRFPRPPWYIMWDCFVLRSC